LNFFPSDEVTIAGLPAPPEGTRLSRVDVIVRVRR
jgi:Fur family iron response transcriptional regulator